MNLSITYAIHIEMKTRGHVAHDIQLIEMKKEYDIDRNLEDASAACVKLEEENTKIENYSEGTLKNTDSVSALALSHNKLVYKQI